MPFKHIAYLRVKSTMTEEEGVEMLKDLKGLTKCPLVIGGEAGKNHEMDKDPKFQYAMAFDFATPEDKKGFKGTPETQAFLAKWGSFMEDASELNFVF